jgi:uncharacterized protein YjbJ (UPF0337 family)
MNWDIVTGNWKPFKDKVKEEWGDLTENQLDVIAGRHETLSSQLQAAYGMTQDEAEEQIKHFEAIHHV